MPDNNILEEEEEEEKEEDLGDEEYVVVHNGVNKVKGVASSSSSTKPTTSPPASTPLLGQFSGSQPGTHPHRQYQPTFHLPCFIPIGLDSSTNQSGGQSPIILISTANQTVNWSPSCSPSVLVPDQK
ncbi:hypothetical protein BG005_003015 [Podila minutissima]|nr:hypothetical protein BG005_003015 [Podila minutissima]